MFRKLFQGLVNLRYNELNRMRQELKAAEKNHK